MGHFGLVWLVQTTTHQIPNWDSAIGGSYWWLYQFVPGYDSFRYPAKWLPMFAFACSMIAAKTIERENLRREFAKTLIWISMGFVIAVGALSYLRWNQVVIFDSKLVLSSDELWGPLNVKAALSQISHSLVHSVVALLCLAAILNQSRSWSQRRIVMSILLLIAVDLGACAVGIIHRVPVSDEQSLITALNHAPVDPDSRWIRTQSDGGWPRGWRTSTADENRLLNVEASGRAAWFGRWHLSSGAHVLNNMVSIQSREINQFWEASHWLTKTMTPQERSEYWKVIRNWLAIGGTAHTTSNATIIQARSPTAVLVDHHRTKDLDTSMVRCFGQWRFINKSSAQAMKDRLGEIADPDNKSVPVVIGNEDTFAISPDDASALPRNTTQPGNTTQPSSTGPLNVSLRSLHSSPESSEFEVTTDQATLVVLPVYQDGHWLAEYSGLDDDSTKETSDLTVYPVDFLKQGIVLPAGKWRIRFRYAPWWLSWSLATAGITWVFTIVLWWRSRTSRLASSVAARVPAVDASSSAHPAH